MKDSSDLHGPNRMPQGTPNPVIRCLMMWSFERGTLQYDILCGLILAFVFFVPKSCFSPRPEARAGHGATHQATTADPAPPAR